jgi:hypothetical protein
MLVNGDASLLALRDVTLPWMRPSQCTVRLMKKLYTTRHGVEF